MGLVWPITPPLGDVSFSCGADRSGVTLLSVHPQHNVARKIIRRQFRPQCLELIPRRQFLGLVVVFSDLTPAIISTWCSACQLYFLLGVSCSGFPRWRGV